MRKHFGLMVLFFIDMIALMGCSGEQNTETIELAGNPTTGFEWVLSSITPEGIVREVSSKYTPDKTDGQVAGAGGKYVFTFEPIAEGTAEIVFSYLRDWEEGIPAEETRTYTAIVDDKLNLTIAQNQ